MTNFSRRPGIKAWLCSGILLSCAALPTWGQDPDIADPTADNFTPLPAAIESEDDAPAPFADPEVNMAELDENSGLSGQAPNQSGLLKQTAVERQRSFLDAGNRADESAKLARDSFERGLMPLEDYADQALATLEIRLSVAGLQQDRGARISALADHADLMRSAARQLREFDQPASAGWNADCAYAELLSANADLRLASARGDRASFDSAVARSQQHAETHYTLRSSDFNDGLTSLPSLARAASYLTTENGLPAGNRSGEPNEPSKFSEYIATLEKVVEQTKEFAELGAGIGREDRIHEANFELAKATGQAALQQKDYRGAAAAFNDAVDAGQELFRSQVDFYETGTASLRDVTKAWWSQAELLDLASRAGIKTDSATIAATDNELKDLKQLVAAKEDRQGRIAADAAYIKSLESLQGLWARQQAVAVLQANQAAVGKAARKTNRVLELGPGAKKAPVPEGAQPAKSQIEGTTPVTTETTPETTIQVVRPRRSPKK